MQEQKLTGARFERAPLTRTEYTHFWWGRNGFLESAALDHSAIQPLDEMVAESWSTRAPAQLHSERGHLTDSQR